MTLAKWDPFRDLFNLHQRFSGTAFGAPDAYGNWTPAVDIFESGDDLVIRAEVPGIEKDDIDIQVEENRLVIRGERKLDKEYNEETAYRLERVFGQFTRSFVLPKTVDAARISAGYKSGILEIRLPKAEQAKPRRIRIEAA